MDASQSSPWYSTLGAARYCDMTLKAFEHRLARDPSLRRTKRGRRLFFHRDWLDAWMFDGEVKP